MMMRMRWVQEPTETWAAFRLSYFSICPQGGTVPLYLLNMYVAYWSCESYYASMHRQIGDNENPHLLFSLSGPVCLLMYLSAQLAQIASSIIGTRYENVDPCAIAQTHRYDCKREASWGRPTSKSEMGEGERECVSGSEGKGQGESWPFKL